MKWIFCCRQWRREEGGGMSPKIKVLMQRVKANKLVARNNIFRQTLNKMKKPGLEEGGRQNPALPKFLKLPPPPPKTNFLTTTPLAIT